MYLENCFCALSPYAQREIRWPPSVPLFSFKGSTLLSLKYSPYSDNHEELMTDTNLKKKKNLNVSNSVSLYSEEPKWQDVGDSKVSLVRITCTASIREG